MFKIQKKTEKNLKLKIYYIYYIENIFLEYFVILDNSYCVVKIKFKERNRFSFQNIKALLYVIYYAVYRKETRVFQTQFRVCFLHNIVLKKKKYYFISL